MSRRDEEPEVTGDGRERSGTYKPVKGGDEGPGLVLYSDSIQPSRLENESVGNDSDSSSKDPLEILSERSRVTRRLQQRQTILTTGPGIIQISTIDEQKAAARMIRQGSAQRERRDHLDQLVKSNPEYRKVTEQIAALDDEIVRRQSLADRSYRAWKRFVWDYQTVNRCRTRTKKVQAQRVQPSRTASIVIDDGFDPPFEMNLRTLIRSDRVIAQMREEHSRRLAVHHRNRRNGELRRIARLQRRIQVLKAEQRTIKAHLKQSRNPEQPNMITGFSRQSNAQMFRTFGYLDLSPFAERDLVMITLTYPMDWQEVVGTKAHASRHLRRLRYRFEREFGSPIMGLRKLEFQARGAPHFHILMAKPEVGRSGVSFKDWLSRTWADIVDHPDPLQRQMHERAGTRIDAWSGDPVNAVAYFARYTATKNKRYQHVVPQEWLDNGGSLRFWSVWKLDLKKSSVTLDAALDAKVIRRRLRDLDRARRKRQLNYRKHYVLSFRVVNTETGEITLQKVKRSTDLFRNSGGFILLADVDRVIGQIVTNLETCYPQDD